MKDKKGKTVLKALMEIINESNRKANKLWVDLGREFYNELMKEWLKDNAILIYPTHNEDKSVITERFIKTLKSKIYKNMTANDNKSYLPYLNISKLVNQQLHTIYTYNHSVNKKPINADYSPFIEKIGTNPKAPKFKVNDRVRITKYKNISRKRLN